MKLVERVSLLMVLGYCLILNEGYGYLYIDCFGNNLGNLILCGDFFPFVYEG